MQTPLLNNSPSFNNLHTPNGEQLDRIERGENFDAAKLPIHARIDSCEGHYIGIMNSATHNPQFYIGDDAIIPPLLGEAKMSEEDIAAATQNALDPTAGAWDNNPFDDATDLRLEKLANRYCHSSIPIVATQESSTPHLSAFLGKGFTAIDSDNYFLSYRSIRSIAKACIETDQQPTMARARERSTLNGLVFLRRAMHDFSSMKRDWRGLVTYIDKTRFDIDQEHPPRFKMYSDANQKGWRHMVKAFKSFFWVSASWLVGSSEYDNVRQQFKAAKNSVSGVARKDGLLVANLIDKQTGHQVIVCNTHLESFEPTKRLGQRAEMIEELQALKKKFPNATILFMGDMNRPQLAIRQNGIDHDDMVGLFRETLNAQSMPVNQITESFKRQSHLDGIYVIPPEDGKIEQIQGRTLKPYSLFAQTEERYLHYSDHSGVAVNVRVAREGVD